jgi:hypothetical protein
MKKLTTLLCILAALTVVAACMGGLTWNLHVVRERRTALAEWGDKLDSGGFTEGWVKGQNIDLGPGNKLSRLRTWLADAPLYCLQFQDDTEQSVLEYAGTLFPEAKLICRGCDSWDEKVIRDSYDGSPYVTKRTVSAR